MTGAVEEKVWAKWKGERCCLYFKTSISILDRVQKILTKGAYKQQELQQDTAGNTEETVRTTTKKQ